MARRSVEWPSGRVLVVAAYPELGVAAGLVRREVRGREHWMSLDPESLQQAEGWIADQLSFWTTRADALAARLSRRAEARAR